MKQISIEDCEKLQEEFKDYCKSAEQHEFPKLLMIDLALSQTMSHIQDKIENQKDLRAMFRVVLKVMGKDALEYKEE